MKSIVPTSRVNDPISSHLAEEEINRSGVRENQQEIVYKIVKRFPGLTSRELTQACDLDRYQIARRLADLENSGHVIKGPIRACGLGKRKAVTWFPRGPAQMVLFK